MNADSAAFKLSANNSDASSVVCPVCQARFRGSETCSRCGADLSPLLLLSAHAFRLRQKARALLLQGDFRQAFTCVEEAERIRATAQGRLLRAVCTCLL